ncbi:PSD1 and planctomycete cytochrome C domain-containing protein [Opitutia bacterium ISCC 51]|nr:PSD1 and planctomycete cytochrome C domain-containing protein [Opitutae bacterium ISCC 51]QXD27172.1 PSD1 and planctomycete cytochrome C domain-containing protein [Opitutae bacterium ISCC 52]
MEGIFKKITLSIVLTQAGLSLYGEELEPADLEYFEAKVRPLLVEHCYKCHASDSERIRGGFLLDSKPAMLRGGDSGSAITPGDAENSRLVNMIRQLPEFESMPPKYKMAANEIETLVTWINQGAPDPRTEEIQTDALASEFNLEERKQWWSLQPVENHQPPKTEDGDWPSNEIDQFILAKLEERDWQPAEAADRRTLLRRLSFDLIGLAPTPEELDEFVNDRSKNAYQKQVDRLLASPHFGEKWARHWMDLTRYAESKSFEQDYTMAFTWRYRDYLIQALNEDLPYDQFVLESLAGDLLKNPRHHPETGENESVKGPGFIYLTDGQHGPPDIHEDEARIFDGMIDTVSKAFLGTTVACARCHDHKFDAVTTADYYSMYGLLRSSRFAHHNTIPEVQQKRTLKRLPSKQRSLRAAVFDAAKNDVENAAAYLEAAKGLQTNQKFTAALASLESEYPQNKRNKNEEAYEKAKRKVISSFSTASAELDPDLLANWIALTSDQEEQERWPELFGIHGHLENSEDEETSHVFTELSQSLEDWMPQGLGFEHQPSKPGSLIVSGEGSQMVQAIIGDTLVGGPLTARVSGVYRSPDFILDGKPIELEAKGQHGAVRLVVRNYELTGRGPTTAKLYQAVEGNHWQKIKMETYLWEGQPAYFEVLQYGAATHSVKPKESEPTPNDNAYITVRFDGGPDWKSFWNDQEKVAAALQTLWEKGRRNRLNATEAELLSAFFGAGLISADSSKHEKLDRALTTYRSLAHQIPAPRFVRSLTDGDPKDEPVYIRGLHTNASKEPNPRRWLDGLDGPILKTKGSGRLEWAQHVVDPDNPLTSRVLVNRLWKHIFGAGLVFTVNDFGQMGRAPTHPELLDYLAQELVKNDWSVKSIIRELVLSSTYQMSSSPSQASLSEDPANQLLQHMSVRRLEAEAIRDHILASSGELNTQMFGPSAEAYVADLPDSRAKPNPGPLDGDGRRSVYLELRRSFLPTFLRAFDMPNATESTGARQVTNVPAQSLALMNAPFVHEQAEAWAKRITTSDLSIDDRIQQLHITAFSRPATEKEITWANQVLQSIAGDYKTDPNDLRVWTDLCHLMFNRKDFIYLF